jgi:hypothetical protein
MALAWNIEQQQQRPPQKDNRARLSLDRGRQLSAARPISSGEGAETDGRTPLTSSLLQQEQAQKEQHRMHEVHEQP